MRFVIILLVIAFCCDARYVPEDGIYSVAEKLPQYGDDLDQLKTHIDHHLKKVEYDTAGTVFVSFVVDSLGQVNHFKIVRSLTNKHDSIAIATIKNAPKSWRPGISDGKPVAVKMVYPVRFKKE